MEPTKPRGAGRPTGYSRFGEPTAVMRVPVSAKSAVVDFLMLRRRNASPAMPRPHTVFAGGEALSVVRIAQNPPPFAVPGSMTRIPAGFPSPADDYTEEGCDLNQWLVQNRVATYFFTVSGDSVNRLGILDGDRVIVDCSLEPRHGDIVIAIINGEGHTIKKLFKSDTEAALEPDSTNPIHKRRVMTEFDEWMIWGVVTAVVRKFRA